MFWEIAHKGAAHILLDRDKNLNAAKMKLNSI